MSITYRLVLAGIGIVLAVWLALKYVLPLALMYWRGVGIEVPFPRRLAREHPRLVILWSVVGAPLLFLAALVGALYILVSR
jgi:hypothetical protein